MSLGFNHNRRRTATNMPGAIGNNVVIMRRTRVPSGLAPKRQSPTSSPPPAAPPAPPPSIDDVVVRKPVPPPSSSKELPEDMHWVFATCLRPLITLQGTECSQTGDRVLMVYPMEEKNDNICMRFKKVNAKTGQLSYEWVTVYEPDEEVYYLTDFSFTM